MHTILQHLAERVAALLQARSATGFTLTLKVRYHDFQTVTRSATLDQPFETATDLLDLAVKLLARTEAGPKPVRLLGLTVSNLFGELACEDSAQLELPLWQND